MIGHSLRSAWAAGLLVHCLASAQPAAAQAPGGFLHINGIYPVTPATTFETTLEMPLFEETAAYGIEQEANSKIYYDATVGVRIWQGLAAAVGVSFLDTSAATVASGSIPSPLIFDNPRTASFSTELNRRQMDIHLQAVYYLPTPTGIDIALSAGPSLLSITRDSVSSVTLGPESFPFETVSIASLGTTEVRETGIGTNIGADIAFMPSRVFGVGIFVRRVIGMVDSGSQKLDVGGLQAGAGLRFHF